MCQQELSKYNDFRKKTFGRLGGALYIYTLVYFYLVFYTLDFKNFEEPLCACLSEITALKWELKP